MSRTVFTMAARWMAVFLFVLGFGANAASARDIDSKVDKTLERFVQTVHGGRHFLEKARGVLVFSGVIQAGIGIGGEHGEGALRIEGKTVDYYNISAASIGLQLGAEKKDIIVVFLDHEALRKFRASHGWKVGVDGSVVVINVGAGKDIDTMDIHEPIVGFILGQKGLMFNLKLEGTKITKVK